MARIRFFQTIQVKLIVIYVLMILIAMQLIGVYFVQQLESSFKETFSDSLNKQVFLLAEYVEPYLSTAQEAQDDEAEKKEEDLNGLLGSLFDISRAEIQIIDANGIIVSSTSKDANQSVQQKNTRTEVNRALQGIKDERIIVDSDGIRKKVIARPVGKDGKISGAVYIAASMEETYATINRINRIFLTGTLFALALTALLGIFLSNTITAPIKEITKQATALAEGKNFDQQVKVLANDEIGQLGTAFNYMTNRLKEALWLNEEEKEKLASILSNMSDGVIATDEFGRVIVINRRAKQMLRVNDSDVLGREIVRLFGLTSQEIREYSRSENNKTLIKLNEEEEEEALTVQVTFTPIHRREKGVAGTIAVLQDVTEQEKMEYSRREFVANVSHELRTPLTTIKSYLEALGDGAMEDPNLAGRFLAVTRNETERMIRLVTDLLHLSRFDSKQAVTVKEPENIHEMLEEVADRFSFQLRQKSIEIAIYVDPSIQTVPLDRDQIDQVLDNLVSNAIKYTSDEGMLQLSARKTGSETVEISVEDTGIGIPKKDLGRIFDRFYRVDKARSRNMGGTGLGLSIAREIIKAHGGSISLDSEMNQGTRVSFTLPLKAEEAGEA